MKYLLALLLIAPVAALTASPAAYTIPSDMQSATYTLTLTNDEQQTLTLTLNPTGPLSAYITLNRTYTLAPGEQLRIPVRIQLPQATQPGTVTSGILIESQSVTEGTVAAATALMHTIRVVTPKEGMYIQAALLASSATAGNTATLTFSVTNTGTEPIDDVHGSLTVADESLRTLATTLAPGETKNLPVSWTPSAVGSYPVNAIVYYDGTEQPLATTVVVGNLTINITAVRISEFHAGDPFRVAVHLVSAWGEPLTAVASVTIQQNNTRLHSQTIRTLQPLQPTIFPVFFESVELKPGEATVLVEVQYADKTAEQRIEWMIEPQSAEKNTIPLPVILVSIVLILMILVATIFIKRRGSL
jgi:hypothetical protein